ncbi:MAG TPA: diaminopimelate epimerase [Jatrophihabitantaceae bacterium]|nr:diaminopimelate epimerase [Jatrophihabitantaceae bacterium]
MRVVKGHGTENDFVILPDLDASIDLTPSLVRALCDRHSGIGADGVLRVVRSENDREAKEMALEAPFFMDYRNADGSVAEMCGNGVRVFMRYLQGAGLVDGSAAVATRGGIRRVVANVDGAYTVDMGHPLVLADRPVVTAAPLDPVPGIAVAMPNPHVVVFVAPDELDVLDLSRPPRVDPPEPAGQNVEFVVVTGPREITMRVHERGVGETRSCGTGICAAAVAVATGEGVGADGVPWQVSVPGGTCVVEWDEQSGVRLTGPAVLVAEIELDEAWLRAAEQ